jgi:hypothetical protein
MGKVDSTELAITINGKSVKGVLCRNPTGEEEIFLDSLPEAFKGAPMEPAYNTPDISKKDIRTAIFMV